MEAPLTKYLVIFPPLRQTEWSVHGASGVVSCLPSEMVKQRKEEREESGSAAVVWCPLLCFIIPAATKWHMLLISWGITIAPWSDNCTCTGAEAFLGSKVLCSLFLKFPLPPISSPLPSAWALSKQAEEDRRYSLKWAKVGVQYGIFIIQQHQLFSQN